MAEKVGYEGLGDPAPAARAEREGMPTATMVYRDNALFEDAVPKLATEWEALGGKVKIHAFPAGTSEEDMEKWFDGHRNFAEGALLTDDTCGYFVRKKWDGVPLSTASPQPGYLDRIHHIVAQRAVTGDENLYAKAVIRREESPPAEEAFIRIIQNIVEKNLPEKLFLFSDHIRDESHYYSDWFKSKGDSGSPDAASTDREAAERFAEILEAGGVPRERIIIKTAAELDPASMQEMDVPGNWIVIDRHGWIGGKYALNQPQHARYLELPLDSFFNSAMKQELLNVPEENVTRIIRGSLMKLIEALRKESA